MSKLLYQNNPIGGALSNGLPIGTIIPYASNALIPVGFFLCNGQAISRIVYKALFDIIGTLYGPGDGENTFNLPNLNINKFLEGNATAGTVKDAGLPNITGGLATSIPSGTGNNFDYWSGVVHSTSNASTHNLNTGSNKWMNVYIDASHDSNIYGNSETVQPSSVTVRFLIKVFDTVDQDLTLINLTQFADDIALRPTRSQIPAYNKRIMITSSQTWNAPVNGWYSFTLKGAGAGGGGGTIESSYYYGGGGGGEGGTTFTCQHLSTGDSVAITIGAGGSGGSKGAVGSNGGNTSIICNSATFTANGGSRGGAYYTGGIGGNGTIPGAPGGSSVRGNARSQAGGSGGGIGGGACSTWSSNGSAGTMGGGGSGGGSDNSTGGGKGGNGYVIIEYFEEDN